MGALKRSRPIALAGFGAALLCNYWVLEGALAERPDFDSSWISDLAARSEASGWRFQLLAVLSGLAIAGFAAALLRECPRRPQAAGETMLRRGLLALLASGALAAVAGASPLSCPEGIEPTCSLNEDPLDLIHATATLGEIATTVLAFTLIGLALVPLSRRGRPLSRYPGQRSAALDAGWVTLAIGAVWLALTALSGVGYLSDDVDAVKGLLQRADQILFGIWLALLGLWAAHHSVAPE